MNPTLTNSHILKQSERPNLAKIAEPDFILALPESFQTSMFKVISDILNLKGNTDTAKYRDLNWHNACRDTDGKRNRQHMLIQKLKEFYIIYDDYKNVANQTPELIPNSFLIPQKDFKLQLTLAFGITDVLTYKERVASFIGKENIDNLSVRGPELINTTNWETYEVPSLEISRLEKAVELGKSWLDEKFPTYSYTTDEPFNSSSTPVVKPTNYNLSSDLIQSCVLKYDDLYLKAKTLAYKKLQPIIKSNSIPSYKAEELRNLAATLDQSFESLISALKSPEPLNIPLLPTVVTTQQEPIHLNQPYIIQPNPLNATSDTLSSLPTSSLPAQQIGRVRRPLVEPEETTQLVNDWFPNPGESIAPNLTIAQHSTPKPLSPAELAAINKDLGDSLARLLAVPNPVVTPSPTPTPIITTQDKPEPTDPRYNKYFEDAPIPNSAKLYTRIDYMNAGCPGDDFGAWLDEQKARDAALEALEARDSNHTSH